MGAEGDASRGAKFQEGLKSSRELAKGSKQLCTGWVKVRVEYGYARPETGFPGGIAAVVYD